MDEVVTCEKGNYTIENQVIIMGISFFIAHDEKAKKPYMVGEKKSLQYLTKYENLAVTEEFVSALDDWNNRVSEAIEQLKSSA